MSRDGRHGAHRPAQLSTGALNCGCVANQAAIIANQAKLDQILANQVAIKSNQSKLDRILANQEKILGKLG